MSDEGREGLVHAVQAIAGGEAIAEEEDDVLAGRGCRCGVGCCGRYGRLLFRLFAREGEQEEKYRRWNQFMHIVVN